MQRRPALPGDRTERCHCDDPPPAGRTARDACCGRDGKITRDVVLAAALEIIERDGAEGLSMRRLARALTATR